MIKIYINGVPFGTCRHQRQGGDVRPSRLGSDDDDSDDGGDSITVFECPGMMARVSGVSSRSFSSGSLMMVDQ